MVALRTSVFVSESNGLEPNKRVYVNYHWTLIFWNQCYLKCSGGCVFYQVIVIMRVYIDENELKIYAKPKFVHIDLPMKINESLGSNIKFIVSCNESLTEYSIKNEIKRLLFKYEHEHKNN